MGGDGIANDVRQFIFDHIDSVEQLEVLIFLREHPTGWTAAAISNEFRSSQPSIEGRLTLLKSSQMIEESADDPKKYSYNPKNGDIDTLIGRVIDEYKVRKQGILQLIFSPLKKGRNFVRAFVIKPDEGGDGG